MVNTSRNFSGDFDPRFAVRDASMKKLNTAVLITEEPSPTKGRLSVKNMKLSVSPAPVSDRARSQAEAILPKQKKLFSSRR